VKINSLVKDGYDMKIKCAKCKSVEELGQDEIEYLVNIATKYTDDISPNDYTAILSVIKGKCTDGKKHIYIYDEEFSRHVANLIDEHDKLSKNSAIKKKDISDTLEKIENLKNEIEKLGEKRDDLVNEIAELDKNIDESVVKFEKETGTRDMKIWS
jgi:hypothetical protein